MNVSFPYETEKSHIFGTVKRPVAQVSIWSVRRKRWLNYAMIVDTGADYTILPISAAFDLAIDLTKDARTLKTFGIGGSETVHLLEKVKVRIGSVGLSIPVGFLGRDDIPPLLGRQKCLNRLDVLFSHFVTNFRSPFL